MPKKSKPEPVNRKSKRKIDKRRKNDMKIRAERNDLDLNIGIDH